MPNNDDDADNWKATKHVSATFETSHNHI